MDQIIAQNWAYMLYGVVLSVACAQMLVIYVLSNSSHPPDGLGMYSLYFMAGLLVWVVFTLQQNAGPSVTIDVASIAIIINTYILVLATAVRADSATGKYTLGVICVIASFSGFFLQQRWVITVHTGAIALCFLAIGILSSKRGFHYRNIGDGIISFASLIVIAGLLLAGYQLHGTGNLVAARATTYGTHGTAYALIAIGFLVCVLTEYQDHLTQLATIDKLTQLLNRRGLEDALQVTIASASRHSLAISAIMVDIDHFQQINASFGRNIGDRALVEIAAILDREARGSDVLARVGGEEFFLVLPDTDLNSARTLAERLRLAIGGHPLLLDRQKIPVTVSLGVATAHGQVNLETLMGEAGRAMALAKQDGRNRTASVEHKPVYLSSVNPKV
ncbi:MAG: GGDEF domain-containing protein [Halieaceae bacterium]|jgi:diguanylate cyclase (GGDEF)-like protein|nr:GGDEF domain-containing protein [Halieaceae bacterium]